MGAGVIKRRDSSAPPSVPVTSRRYGAHLRLTRGNTVHYYCTLCGKYAFSQDKIWQIPPSKNIYCSKECDEAGFPRWTRWVVLAFLLFIWGHWLLGH